MKRFVFVICLMIFCISLVGCGNSTNSTTQYVQETIGDYSLFKTEDSQEYLDFLKDMDSHNTLEIVDISNTSYALKYTGPYHVYTVTYKVCEFKDTSKQYEYSLFSTDNVQEYFKFLDELDSEFEIVDSSIGTYAFQYTGPYDMFFVTYRKLI